MKVRRTVFTTLFIATTALASSSALAGTKSTVSLITDALVKSAAAVTKAELNQQVTNDVLTAAYHFTPDADDVVYVAKVEVKEIKDEG